MLDVHVLLTAGLRSDWLEQCLESVQLAAGRAPFPVALHVLPGVHGHLGRARQAGYALGTHPYVTHVDDDDYVGLRAFEVLADALFSGAEAVTTGETHIHDDGRVRDCPDERHHLAVFRRDVLDRCDYAAMLYHPDQLLMAHAAPVHVPQCVYVHRIRHDSMCRVHRRAHREDASRELRSIPRPERGKP